MLRIAGLLAAAVLPLALTAQVVRYVAERFAISNTAEAPTLPPGVRISDGQEPRMLSVAPRDLSPPAVDTTIIDGGRPGCTACSLVVSPAMRLGSVADRQLPRRVPGMVRDSRGVTYLHFDGWVNQPILRYDSAGAFLGAVGRYGRAGAIGEYVMTSDVFVGAGDSLFVWADGRLQVFASDGTFARAVATPTFLPGGLGNYGSARSPFAAQAAGGLYAVTRDLYAERRFAYRLRPDGTVRDSVPLFTGLARTSGLVVGGVVQARSFSYEPAHPLVAPDGSVWTFMWKNYRLEHHALDGTRRLLGVQIPGTVPPVMTNAQAESLAAQRGYGVPQYVGGGRVPKPRIHAAVDRDGLLWVLRTVAAPGWDTVRFTPTRGAPNEAPNEESIPRGIEDRLYHTFVEVIDPKTTTMLARVELPFLGMLAGPGSVGRVTTDGQGRFVTSLYQITLKQ